jgi:hypothetical protein
VQSHGNLGPAYGAPGYGAPYGYGYGYGQNYNYRGHFGALQARVNQIQRQIAHLARYRMISPNEYRNLMQDSRNVEQRLRLNRRDGRGLTQREMAVAERQIYHLEQKIARDVRDGRQWRYRW